MGSKKLQVWLPLLLALIMVLGMMIGYQLRDKTNGSSFLNTAKKTSVQEVLELVRGKYVDPVGGDSINQIAINELLSHLDPHSVYIPATELKDVNEQLSGKFQGIGIEFQVFNDTINVINVLTNGPSEKAGVEVGDKIIKANDTILLAGVKIKPEAIRKQLRGTSGSQVKITVLRNGQQKDIIINRGMIPMPSVDAAYIIAPGTGYIHINKFADHTYAEFMMNLEKLQKQGMDKLIVDLRGNGGGLMNEATNIADEFLDEDKLIVYTEGNKSSRYEYHAKREGLFEKGKLVLLVNETSASASEVLAGALQDWDRAVIVGRRTFGKGLVQQQFTLSDGSAVRLTVARYYTPLGRNIQKPYTNGKDKYEEELMNRFHDGEVVTGDTAKPKGPAFKTHGGHIVYGGGGITPDVFVAFDTAKLPPAAAGLYYKNTLGNFVYHYFMEHKAFFQSVKSPHELETKFNPGENEWQLLCAFAVRDDLQLNTVTGKAKDEILKKIQALMARQIWRNEGYYELINLSDPVVQKGIAVIK